VVSPGINANAVQVCEFTLTRAVTINKISYYVNASSASDKWGFGIYSSAGNLLVNSGIIAPTTGTAAASVTLGTPVTLPPGVYFFAEASSGTTANNYAWLSGSTGSSQTLQAVFNLNKQRRGTAANAFSSSTGLPSTLGTIGSLTEGGFSIVLFEN
jgi:hypothetical protein